MVSVVLLYHTASYVAVHGARLALASTQQYVRHTWYTSTVVQTEGRRCSRSILQHWSVESRAIRIRDVRYEIPKTGPNIIGNTRKHIHGFVTDVTARKKNTDKFPPEGIHVRCPRQEIHVCCPPRHVSAVTARDAFSTAGDKRVLSPPWACALG